MKPQQALEHLTEFVRMILIEYEPSELHMSNVEAIELAQAIKVMLTEHVELIGMNERLNEENKALIKEAAK